MKAGPVGGAVTGSAVRQYREYRSKDGEATVLVGLPGVAEDDAERRASREVRTAVSKSNEVRRSLPP